MEELYNSTKFNPLRGGHAPSQLRQAFLDALEQFFVDNGDDISGDVEAGAVSLRKLAGLLYNCSDILPRHYQSYVADLLELNHDSFVTRKNSGFTYAQAARHIVYYYRRLSVEK